MIWFWNNTRLVTWTPKNLHILFRTTCSNSLPCIFGMISWLGATNSYNLCSWKQSPFLYLFMIAPGQLPESCPTQQNGWNMIAKQPTWHKQNKGHWWWRRWHFNASARSRFKAWRPDTILFTSENKQTADYAESCESVNWPRRPVHRPHRGRAHAQTTCDSGARESMVREVARSVSRKKHCPALSYLFKLYFSLS